RVRHPQGEWKVSDRDPRVIVRREPGELLGAFYKIFPEGRVRRNDPLEPVTAAHWGDGYPGWPRDFNRNYPHGWSPAQQGAGPHPLSEPETQAQINFIQSRPNIAAMLAYHTAAGTILQPVPHPPAEGFDSQDLHLYKILADLGTRRTGYPALPSKNFQQGISGHFTDWAYHHMGVMALLVELWDVGAAAGIQIPYESLGDYYQDLSEDDQVRLFQWLDRELDGDGFAPWTAFDHPDLGEVEIGGWCLKFTRQNPPPHLLFGEIKKNPHFIFDMAAALPRTELGGIKVTAVKDGVYRLQVQVRNDGYLPSFVTRKAIEIEKADPIQARLEVAGGTVTSAVIQPVGHLEGRSAHGETAGRRGYSIYGHPLPRFEELVEWTVQVDDRAGFADAVIVAGSPRTGTARQTVRLGPASA
ncbi:MAG: M14 family zinc carboxypeptidase, partial [Thermaerobacterales bacterium]